MAVKTPRAKSGPSRARAAAGRRFSRRWIAIAAFALLAWLALSHVVVRVRLRSWLERTFEGEASVPFAILRPDMVVVAWGPSVEGETFGLFAGSVSLDLSLWGLLGGEAIRSVEIDGLRGEVAEGSDLDLFREPVREGDEADGDLDLDPPRVPPLFFDAPEILLRAEGEEARRVFSTEGLSVRQVGDRSFDVTAGHGRLGGLPFEKLTGRLIPRGDHLLLNDVKMRSFNGMIGGVIDVDLNRAGALNGDLEGHFLEVEEIWRTYGLSYAEKRRGDLSGSIVFEAERPALEALKGTGTLRLRRARFFSPLSFRILVLMKVPVERESMLTGGEMKVSFERSLFYIEEGRFDANEFELECQGLISFDGRGDLEVNHAGTTVAVHGALEDPQIKVLPFDSLTAPFDRLFRERIRGR